MTRVENPQELQGMRRELETAVSAATVAEAQEEQAVNEAREADGRLAVAKMLGGAGEVGGWALEKDGIWKFLRKYGHFSGNMGFFVEIWTFLWKYCNFCCGNMGIFCWKFLWKCGNLCGNMEISVEIWEFSGNMGISVEI